MGYRRAHDNPIFGSSVTDAVIAANATWTGVNAYRNLTLGNGSDPVTIQADSMKYGPLVIRCSGTLRVRNNAVLHSDGMGAFFPGSGSWSGDGGLWSWGPGVSSLSVFSWSASGATAIENAREGLVVIGAGGGGGWGTLQQGFDSRLGWCMGGSDWRYYSPLFTDYRVGGGQVSGQAGENGGDHITGGQDPADYIASVLMQLGVGTGGGCGGRDSGGGIALGGISGGSLIIMARQVVVETGGIIRANGAAGAAGGAADGGGGGGGSGGYIGIFTEKYTNDGTVEVAGGAGGAKTGTGGDGGSGSVGCVKIERAA